MASSQQILSACQQSWTGPNRNACNYFVRDVANALGVNENDFLNATANVQVARLRLNPNWTKLGQGDTGASSAIAHANAGHFVIAGWVNPANGHGHVAVAISGPAVNGWPRGCWGEFPNGPGGFNHGLRETFGTNKRPTTEFFALEI